jgi:hypothetical protein
MNLASAALFKRQMLFLPVFAQNIGIAAVTPAYLLRDILYSDELKKLRADHPIKPTEPVDK